jgi:2-succinyl-5-enolpyruvyl-6-hydroxy-3-cyclohexene-1-carboxylate synthase
MPAANAGAACALVLVDELVRHGVTDAVLAPGSRSTPIALALGGHEQIRLHVRIDERSAAFLALGLVRGSGRPVPVLCTSGTATAHLHAAALEADQSRLPLLLLTADRPPELRGVGANQTVDQVGLFGTAVRWSCDLGVPEARDGSVRYWRSTVSRAVAVALGRSGGPAGPVQLNLPLREPLTDTPDDAGWTGSLDGRPEGQPWTGSVAAPAPLAPELAALLAGTQRGVAVAGDGVTADDAAALVRFCARRGWPLIAEPHSNARRGPAALRATDALLASPRFDRDHRPDLVLVAGRVGLSRDLLSWLGRHRHVIVDRDGCWWDPGRSAERIVRSGLDGLDQVAVPSADDWLASWRAASRAAAAAVDELLDAEPELGEPRVARDLAAGLPDDAILVVGSSLPIRQLDLTMAPRDGLRVLANRGVSGIDGFVSTAAGVALAAADHPVVGYAGDLSLLHDANGLLANEPVGLVLVVVNNDGGAIFRLLPQARDSSAAALDQLFVTPHGRELSAVAAAYGAEHCRVRRAAELLPAVSERPSGIRIVEVRTDGAATAELHRRLRAAADAAVS